MKLIIAGPRDFPSDMAVSRLIDYISEKELIIDEVVSGGAVGADQYGEKYADLMNIVMKRFPANWSSEGRAAGPIRNQKMAEYADELLLLLHKPILMTKGSLSMRNIAQVMKMPIHYFSVKIDWR